MSLPTYYEIFFWTAQGRNVGGVRVGFADPDKEIRRYCADWMTANRALRPVRWTYKFVGGSLRAT